MIENIIFTYRSPSDHLHDRVNCTYEMPVSSELQSFDPVLVQQMQSSAELTVHLTLSQTEFRPAICETLSDCEKECEYDDVDETNRKSRSVNTVLVSGEKGLEQPPALCDKKGENKDHVYAVVHKERKGRASSEASTLKKSSDRPQEGTSGLPLNRGSCVDCIGRSSHPTDSGLQNNINTAESERLQPGGSIDYLYAAVDKTKKKRKKPQVIITFHKSWENFFVVVVFLFCIQCCLIYQKMDLHSAKLNCKWQWQRI